MFTDQNINCDAWIAFQIVLTRKETKELVLRHIPEILVNLVGQQAARNGVAKVFEVLQEQTLNKQIFYELMEHLCNNLWPELLIKYAEQKLSCLVTKQGQ